MIKVSSIGKFLDQPLLTAKLNKQIPTILTLGSGIFLAKELKNTPKEDKIKKGIQTSIILATTSISAIKAPKIANYLTKRPATKTLEELKIQNSKSIKEIITNNKYSEKVESILHRAKDKILSLKEVDTLHQKLDKQSFDKIIPPPTNITSNDLFREIGWLSIFGAIPVAGGVAGGIAADMTTEKDWKSRVSNKVKEGTYQYLANIFMCNIGAGAALGILEHNNIKSKSARCIGMITGIILTGVIGGSAIANFISNKLINPLLSGKNQNKKEIRTPELLDLGLHTDDIATVSLLSGLKWIEPSLPLLYAVSGYRAGIGYRNNDKHHHSKNCSQNQETTHFLREKC